MNDTLRSLNPRWGEFLQNPVWYVATVAALAVLTSYLPFLWWFAGLVALTWGAWLIRQLFGETGEDGSSANEQAQLEAYLEQTLAYKTQINRAIEATTNDYNRFHLAQLATQLDTCTKAIKEMVQRLTRLRQDALIRRDLETVPEAVANLEAQLTDESNAALTAQLEHVLIARKNQLALLDRLQNTVKQTELQLEHTLSVLGTIYSQILIGQSTNNLADYGRLSANIDEEMRRLADQLEALGEVKGDYWRLL